MRIHPIFSQLTHGSFMEIRKLKQGPKIGTCFTSLEVYTVTDRLELQVASVFKISEFSFTEVVCISKQFREDFV